MMIGFIELIELHASNGARILVNPTEVSVIREPTDAGIRHLGQGAKCVLVMSNGQFNAVREDCDTVRGLLVKPD